jgi:hypothetical protein
MTPKLVTTVLAAVVLGAGASAAYAGPRAGDSFCPVRAKCAVPVLPSSQSPPSQPRPSQPAPRVPAVLVEDGGCAAVLNVPARPAYVAC